MPTPPKKPSIIVVGPVRVRPYRPPCKSDPRWSWRAERYLDGQTVPVWSGRGTPEEVTRVVSELVSRDQIERRSTGGEVETVKQLLERWLGQMKQDAEAGALGTRSFRAYKIRARRLKEAIGDVRLAEVTKQTLEGYRNRRLRQGRAPITVDSELVVLGAAWNWGREIGILDELRRGGARPLDHLPEVKLKREPRSAGRTPTPGEVERVVREMHGWSRMAVLFIYLTGARPHEVQALRWRHVDLERASVSIPEETKTGAREVSIGKRLVVELRAWRPPAVDPDAQVLGITYHTLGRLRMYHLRRACEAAGVAYFTPKALRCLAADTYARSGVDVKAAAEQLGHSVKVMLEHYRKVQEVDRRRAASLLEAGLAGGDVIEVDFGGAS